MIRVSQNLLMVIALLMQYYHQEFKPQSWRTTVMALILDSTKICHQQFKLAQRIWITLVLQIAATEVR